MANFKIYLFLSLVLCFAAHAADPAENFGGLPKGFLNKKVSSPVPPPVEKPKPSKPNAPSPQEKEKALVPSQPCAPSAGYTAALTLFEKHLEDDNENSSSPQETLWGHPFFLSEDMRYKIYGVCGGNVNHAWLKETEDYFVLLASGNPVMRETACRSPQFFKNILKLWVFFQNSYWHSRIIAPLSEKPELLPFVVQNLAHWVIQSKFDYMKGLASAAQEKFKENFITPESDFEKGEFVLWGTGWDSPPPLPKQQLRYCQQTLSNKKKIYRIISQGATNYKWIPIIGDPTLGYYVKEEIFYFSNNSSRQHASGLIFDKSWNLVEKEGIVLTKGWAFPQDYHLFFYRRHPLLDQPFFFQQEIFNKDKIPPLFQNLLESVGGIEQLDERKFIFIPTPDLEADTGVSPITARLALPYLYELKEEVRHNPTAYAPAQIGWIDETIEALTTVLVEEACGPDNLALEQEIVNEMAQENVSQELENKASALSKKIEEAQNAVHETGEKRKKLRKAAKKKIIKKATQEKAQQIDREVLRQQRKEKALRKIEKEYTEKAALKRNFSKTDVQELLGEMVKDLSPLGIETTGEAHARGSHAAVQIMDKDSTHSTYFNVAARPQKRGYQSGTVKTIIKDMIQKVTSLVRRKKD